MRRPFHRTGDCWAVTDDIQFMRKFYEAKLGKYPDVLSSKQISSFTGYDTTSVNNWCEKNKLRHFCIKRKNLVPKVYLIDFLVSWDYIGIGVKSKRHKNMNKKLWKELQSQRWLSLRQRVCSNCKEGISVRKQRYYVPVTHEELRFILQSLIRLKNRLIREGRYTDCVDELIAKIAAE